MRKRGSTTWKASLAITASSQARCADSEFVRVLTEAMNLFDAHESSEWPQWEYWRICHEHDENFQAGFCFASLLFACDIHRAVGHVWVHRPIERPAFSSDCEAVPSGVAAACRADCLVPGRLSGTDFGRLHLSNSNCRGRPLDAKPFQPQGPGASQRGRQAGLGSQRKGRGAVSLG